MNYNDAREMCLVIPDKKPVPHKCAACGRHLNGLNGFVRGVSGTYCEQCWNCPGVWIPEKFDSYSWQLDIFGNIVDMNGIKSVSTPAH